MFTCSKYRHVKLTRLQNAVLGSINVIHYRLINFGTFSCGCLVSIAQWLERRPPNPAIVGPSPGGDRHICACHVEVKLPPDK